MSNKSIFYLFLLLITFSCASKQPQYKTPFRNSISIPNKAIQNRFFLLGDAGKRNKSEASNGIKAFQLFLKKNKTSSLDYTLFLGDNSYPSGLPYKNDPLRAQAEANLNMQIESVANFNGKTIFLPGNHDWYSNGVKGLKNQEKYIKKALGKNSFKPENGCPIERVDINTNVALVILDTQWYLEDWNKNPTINDNCHIKTREHFFLEIESALKKAQNKTIILAMHHPMYTNGTHGGFYSASKHLFPFQKKIPLPGVASLITQIRSQGGVSSQDRFNQRYNTLMSRLETLVFNYGNLVIASGHEHSLQYIQDTYVKQIVSGSASKSSGASLSTNGLFSYGKQGFAELTIFKDGSSWVQFYGLENKKLKRLYAQEVFKPRKKYTAPNFNNNFKQTTKASVYTKEETEHSELFESFWGKHYRDMYSQKINVKVATLDTLYGGLEIVRKGGGHQTRSLRLKDKNGKQYNMRALKKSATQYLQTVLFKNKQFKGDFEKTNIEKLILDFYTSAHPYAFLTVPQLSSAIDVLHTNPKLYYVPKHKHLGIYNKDFGDELYLIEERPEKNHAKEQIFDFADDIKSTPDVLTLIRKNEKHKIDENAFIKARLFDMLLGDWDRHEDQWRWAQFNQPNGNKLYKPIPRDRDQVFSNFDGGLLAVAKFILKPSKQLQVYDDDINEGDLIWMNKAGIKLDRILIQNSNEKQWIKQAEYIQNNITQKVIDSAFKAIPREAYDSSLSKIKTHFINRKSNLVKIARRYYKLLNKLAIITATDKDDFIDIIRHKNGKTEVIVYRNKNGKRGNQLLSKTFYKKTTKEIWIYGLDNKDTFTVTGKANKAIKVRLIGGQNKDSYEFKDGKNIIVYDYKSKANTLKSTNGAKIKFTDIYDNNVFNYKKYIYKTNSIAPLVGFNPDDGLLTGISITNTKFGYERNPFTSKQNIRLGYYFATEGLNLRFDGEYNIFKKWNLNINSQITSSSFATNFFGFGNNTKNNDNNLDLDFNRVRTSIYSLKAGLLKKGIFGSNYGFKTVFEGIKLDPTSNRFITTFTPATDTEFYKRSYFIGAETVFNYQSLDTKINPKRGMEFNFETGLKQGLNTTKSTIGFINSHLGFYNHLTTNKKLVLKTDLRTQLRFGKNIPFYQAANIGGKTGLRGFRTQRFTGQNALTGSADFRYSFNKIRTRVTPLQFGVFTGVDAGRVWLRNQNSNLLHTSYGGGFWVSAAQSVSGTFSLFNSKDGSRFAFSFGVNF